MYTLCLPIDITFQYFFPSDSIIIADRIIKNIKNLTKNTIQADIIKRLVDLRSKLGTTAEITMKMDAILLTQMKQ